MKPLGPIPPGFAMIDGQLAIGGRKARDLVAEVGSTPLFVYSADRIRRRVSDLLHALPQTVALHYAVKANPFEPVLQLMSDLVDGFDIASGGELSLALAAGLDPARISFAGPGKRTAEIEAAITAGATLNLESEGEAVRALEAGHRLGVTPRLAIRVNPPFDLKGSGMKMGGGAKPFGVDADRVGAMARAIITSGAEWRGLHIFAGSQALSADAIIDAQRSSIALAGVLAEETGQALPHCNLGGGLGIPYFPGDEPVDLAAIGTALGEALEERATLLAETQFCLELGRYLVGEAGVYLTEIVDRKSSHDELFLVVDGGLHHQLAASGNFGTVVRRNYPVAVATRMDEPASEVASVVGCLCTPLDRLADKGQFPRAEPGDLIAVFCAGAYGASASPAQFLGHGPALEMLV